MTSRARSALIKRLGAELGFDRVGVAPAEPLPNGAYYRDWLARGYAGSMDYLHHNAPYREHPGLLVAGAKSIISVALSYRRPEAEDAPEPHRAGIAPPAEPRQPAGAAAGRDRTGSAPGCACEPAGRVARYARGRDYHVVLGRMLDQLIEGMRRCLDAPFEARRFVDGAPLIEREIAARAGIGWIGKNTLVLHGRLGSYLFLGEIITTLELEADPPATDHCGSCTRCLDACPTGAFPAAYQMDASRCISYLTIEHRGKPPEPLRSAVGDWVFGCDICQEVCPYNAKAPLGTHVELREMRIPARIPLAQLLQLSSGDHRRLTRGTAARRAPRGKWQANAEVVKENGRDA